MKIVKKPVREVRLLTKTSCEGAGSLKMERHNSFYGACHELHTQYVFPVLQYVDRSECSDAKQKLQAQIIKKVFREVKT